MVDAASNSSPLIYLFCCQPYAKHPMILRKRSEPSKLGRRLIYLLLVLRGVFLGGGGMLLAEDYDGYDADEGIDGGDPAKDVH